MWFLNPNKRTKYFWHCTFGNPKQNIYKVLCIVHKSFTFHANWINLLFLCPLSASEWKYYNNFSIYSAANVYIFTKSTDSSKWRTIYKGFAWSLVSIYVDDTTVYRRTSKHLDDQNQSAYLSAELTLVTQCGKTWLVKFNRFKIKFVTFNYHRAEPGFFYHC